MTAATPSYRTFTGNAAQNYERDFVPAIATPVSTDLLAAAALQRGERVLDVACGTGAVTRLAAERVGPTGTVTAVDIAPEMIDVAKSSAAGRTGVHVEWHVGDAAALEFADASYDVALCQMGLMFMDDRAGALAEMHRVLVDGGRVAVNTPGTMQPVFEIMEQAIVEHIDAGLGMFVHAVFSMHDARAVAALLRAAGFRDVVADVKTTRLQLPAPAEFLWKYINLAPIGAAVAAAPEGTRLALEADVVDRWAPFVVDGKTIVDQPMVVASGRR
jgi:ubiquinone/menaquinone biosynthesis C-methylase UbiE